MTTRPLGAQISHMLKSREVEVIFGIPGVHNQEMYRGIEEAGLTHVLARNEQGAGFMADGYARATGKPGVAYVITGPGLCNIMNPMGQAYSDSVPMLVISSCLDDTVGTQGQLHQMLDQEAAAASVCDWSHEARGAEAAYQLVDRALLEFKLARPRPKHIQVPIHVLEGTAEACPPRPIEATRLPEYGAEVGAITSHLATAKRPIFVLGGGAKSRDLRGVLQQCGAACFTTYAARGVVGADYPLDFGANLARGESVDVIGSADLVIVIGSTLSEVDLWRDTLGATATVIRIDIDPEALSDSHRAQVNICADSGPIIEALCDETKGWSVQSGWTIEEVTSAKARWRAQTDAERPGIAPLVDALREVAPDNTMFYSDMTQFAYVAKEIYPMKFSGHWHHPYGFGTLGYALPAAIGGKVGVPDQPVISINGDSGFQYNVQELATAVELGLNLPIIVWDNGKLKEIEDSMTRSQIAPNAVIARNPDFCKLAEAYGARATAPRSIAAFKQAVLDALAADGPTLIHITPETALA